jgi:uncharacterized protein (DUF433 family)
MGIAHPSWLIIEDLRCREKQTPSFSQRCLTLKLLSFEQKYMVRSDRLAKMHSHIMNYRNYITIEPNKRGGKPCVRSLRITVYEVLEYLASEMTEAEILDDFPDLTREDLKACIAYAADRERRLMISTLSA